MKGQRFKTFNRRWFGDEEEIEKQVNDWLAANPNAVVESFSFSSTREQKGIAGDDPEGSDDLVILYHVEE